MTPNEQSPAPPDPTARGPSTRDLVPSLRALVDRMLAYSPKADVNLVRRAFWFAAIFHCPHRRASGERYITHPFAAAETLVSMNMDAVAVAAVLLHDVVEDSRATLADLEKHFGSDVARLVDGVTKMVLPGQAKTAADAHALMRVLFYSAQDFRVLIVKLADRLHNMATLDSLDADRRKEIAEETLRMYAPIAGRLGIWQIKWQMEDLAFKYVHPEAYARISELVAATRADRETEVAEAIEILKARLAKEGIQADVTGRPKHLYSIWNKMQRDALEFHELYDLVALRVIVSTRNECYVVLGIVSDLWRPVPGMYSDFIAQSKPNLYQSLHIKVLGPREQPLEVQIRTRDMHRTAEFGLAAHWQYKEGGRVNDTFEKRLADLRSKIFQRQDESASADEFLQNIGQDFFRDQVAVYTPKYDVIELPAGSTVLDFAFHVHTDVGMHCRSALVNGKQVPFAYRLQNGDTVAITTHSSAHPSLDWLGLVHTASARARVRQYFKKLNQAEHIAAGRELLERELSALTERRPDAFGPDPKSFLSEASLREIAPRFNYRTETELLAAIGYGTLAALTVLNRMRPPAELPMRLSRQRSQADSPAVRSDSFDTHNVMFRRARCCLPIPGDEVFGYTTRGHGMALHRSDCPNLVRWRQIEPERCQPVVYAGRDGQTYQVFISMKAVDYTGLLANVTNCLAQSGTNLTYVRTHSHIDATATIEMAVDVRDTTHLATIMQKVQGIRDILEVHRMMGGRDEPRNRS